MPSATLEQARQNQRRQTAKFRDERDTNQLSFAIKNPRRRKACDGNFLKWLTTYTSEAFYCKFGPHHLKLIETVQDVVMDGGRVVCAMPRGSGKTTVMQRAIIWATLAGHARFAVLCASDDGQATRLVEGIRTLLNANEKLLEDYPEVIGPIKMLENAAIRANFQSHDGVPTKVMFSAKGIRYPTVPMSVKRGNAGSIIRSGGLTGAMRGMVETGLDGKQLRPDLILIDDPQTRQSAHSPSQCRSRQDILDGDLAGMSGVGTKMSIFCACTVIEADDLACRLLDKDHSPDWIGIKVPMMKSMPADMELWDRYNELRAQEAVFEVEQGSANDFYTEHRRALDKGAEHYWPERIDSGRVSAIQSAMDAYFKSPRAFASEYQNDPEEGAAGDLMPLKAVELVKRQHPFGVGDVPPSVSNLTCHIDVQRTVLYWMVVGWTPAMRGYIIEYGVYPKQPTWTFALPHMRKTLEGASGGNDADGAIQSGVESLVTWLESKTWPQQAGGDMPLSRGLIDGRYKPEAVEQGLLAAKAKLFMPSYGIGIGAKNKVMSKWVRKAGAHYGNHWISSRPESRLLRAVHIDVNYWKSRAYESLKVPKEHGEAVTFYEQRQLSKHQSLAEHLCSEVAVRVTANGMIVDEWELPSHRPDNHLWDNLVGNFAAASTLGIRKATDVTAIAGKKRGRQPNRKKANRLKV